MAWQLTQCSWDDKQQLNTVLANSWEPFAVGDGDRGPTIWLRRQVSPADAEVVELPQRPRHEPEVAPR